MSLDYLMGGNTPFIHVGVALLWVACAFVIGLCLGIGLRRRP